MIGRFEMLAQLYVRWAKSPHPAPKQIRRLFSEATTIMARSFIHITCRLLCLKDNIFREYNQLAVPRCPPSLRSILIDKENVVGFSCQNSNKTVGIFIFPRAILSMPVAQGKKKLFLNGGLFFFGGQHFDIDVHVRPHSLNTKDFS